MCGVGGFEAAFTGEGVAVVMAVIVFMPMPMPMTVIVIVGLRQRGNIVVVIADVFRRV